MTLSTETIQIISKHKLLTPRSRSTETPALKVTRALSLVIRVGLVAPALIAASMSANAADAITCKLNWMATINAQAAMQPVELIIRDDKTNEIVKQTTNHSGVYHLPCTQYTATATIGDLTRGRSINLITPSADLIIEMGE